MMGIAVSSYHTTHDGTEGKSQTSTIVFIWPYIGAYRLTTILSSTETYTQVPLENIVLHTECGKVQKVRMLGSLRTHVMLMRRIWHTERVYVYPKAMSFCLDKMVQVANVCHTESSTFSKAIDGKSVFSHTKSRWCVVENVWRSFSEELWGQISQHCASAAVVLVTWPLTSHDCQDTR